MGIKPKLRSIARSRRAQYVLSLPERVLRSASALSAGAVRELAEVVLPAGIRRGRLYTSLVEATLRFVIAQVGRVEDVYPAEQAIGENFLLRRTLGNGLEAMGIIAFRASPVWVLAALADLCGAGRQIIPEIADSLKREGLLDPDVSFTTMEQLLEGLEGTAAQLADTVNAPPLDVSGLREEWAKLVLAAKRLPEPSLPSRQAVAALWSDLRKAAAQENRSVFELSSLLALSAVRRLPKSARVLSRSAALALGKGGGVLSVALLEHYRSTLQNVREIGFPEFARRQLAPYLRAALKGFSPAHETLTGNLLKKL